MTKSTRYSPEVRARAVRMVFEHQGELPHAVLRRPPGLAKVSPPEYAYKL